MPAASVGDATPKKIDPSTAKMRKNGRMNALIIFIALVFFLKSLIKESGIAGTLSGYNFDINVTEFDTVLFIGMSAFKNSILKLSDGININVSDKSNSINIDDIL